MPSYFSGTLGDKIFTFVDLTEDNNDELIEKIENITKEITQSTDWEKIVFIPEQVLKRNNIELITEPIW